MRKTMTMAMAALLAATALSAQEHHHHAAAASAPAAEEETPEQHLAHLRAYAAAHSQHGPVIPQPASVNAAATVAVTVTGRSFAFSPSTFTVNQGDVVTLTFTVPASDPAPAHGILMETYIEDGMIATPGDTVQKTFTATTAGSFLFVCSVPSCGVGHSSMDGKMIVQKVTAAAPTIASINPPTGSTAGGDSVTITGTGFSSNARVTIGGVAATNVTVTSSTSITATTPAHGAGKADVVVTNADNQSATLSQAFTFVAPPSVTVTGISPATGPTSGGTLVTISGSGFQQNATVTIAALPATNVTVIDANTITARTPLGPATELLGADVTVRNPDGTSATLTRGFTYSVPALAVLSVTPNTAVPTGTSGGGPTTITIYGNGFTTALPTTVTVGGTAATAVQIIDAVTIRATIAARAASTADVTVTVGGTSATLRNGFSWQKPPSRHRAAR